MDQAQWLAFLIAITLLTISPGVDTLLVLRNTQRGGWRDGIVSSLGICSGLFFHVLISAVGISVILLQSAWAFTALKLVGAAYLIWLGIQSLKAMRTSGTMVVPTKVSGEFRVMRSLREGLLSNVLNPKTIVFYMAFLPQFIDPTGQAVKQSLLLAGVHFCISMVWLGVLTFALHRVKHSVLGGRVERYVQGLTGGVMVLLGLKLATDR